MSILRAYSHYDEVDEEVEDAEKYREGNHPPVKWDLVERILDHDQKHGH